jgi:hypothetical protein
MKAGRKEGMFYPCCTGMVLGVFILSYPQALGLIPIIIIYWIINRAQRIPSKITVLLLITLIIILPWFIRNYTIHGNITNISTNGGFNFWMGNNPFTKGIGWGVDIEQYKKYIGHRPLDPVITQTTPPDPVKDRTAFRLFVTNKIRALLPNEVRDHLDTISESDMDREFYRSAMNHIRENPGPYIVRSAKKAIYFWVYRPPEGREKKFSSFPWNVIYIIHYAFLVPLAIAGVYVSRRQWRELSLLYLIFFFFTAVYMNFFVLSRYRWLIDGLLIVLSGVFLDRLFTLLFQRRK